MVNVFGIEQGDGRWTLVDTGLPFSANRIRGWARAHFGERAPSAILLTHGHFDHVGTLEELAEGWDVPIYAHPMEFPYLTGKSAYPPPDPTVGRGAMAVLSPLYPKGPIDVSSRLRPYPEDGTVPDLPQWRWIHTPGHTAGHVSFFRENDGVLIAGDAFVTTRQESFLYVATQKFEVNGPPSYFTSDWEAAKLSVERLADLQPSVIACGHGMPVSGPEGSNQLSWLADNFDAWAKPEKGRYVAEPAYTDERGVVFLPPSVSNPLPYAVVAGAFAAGALLLWASSRRASRSES